MVFLTFALEGGKSGYLTESLWLESVQRGVELSLAPTINKRIVYYFEQLLLLLLLLYHYFTLTERLNIQCDLVLRRGYVLEYLVVNRIVVKRVLLKWFKLRHVHGQN